MMIAKVRGVFKKFDADVHTSGIDFSTAVIDLWIDTSSVYTGDEKRDEHLRSDDFFDVANFKEISFTSDSISKADAGSNHEMWGKLSIKGISKVIELNVVFGGIITDPWGNERAGFSVTGKINRKDWNLNWNTALSMGGVMLSDEIKINWESLHKTKGETRYSLLQFQIETIKSILKSFLQI